MRPQGFTIGHQSTAFVVVTLVKLLSETMFCEFWYGMLSADPNVSGNDEVVPSSSYLKSFDFNYGISLNQIPL